MHPGNGCWCIYYRGTRLAILDRFVAATPASCQYESYFATTLLTMALLHERVEFSVMTESAALMADLICCSHSFLSTAAPSPSLQKSFSRRWRCHGSKSAGSTITMSFTSSITSSCSAAVRPSTFLRWIRALRYNSHCRWVMLSRCWTRWLAHVLIFQ